MWDRFLHGFRHTNCLAVSRESGEKFVVALKKIVKIEITWKRNRSASSDRSRCRVLRLNWKLMVSGKRKNIRFDDFLLRFSITGKKNIEEFELLPGRTQIAAMVLYGVLFHFFFLPSNFLFRFFCSVSMTHSNAHPFVLTCGQFTKRISENALQLWIGTNKGQWWNTSTLANVERIWEIGNDIAFGVRNMVCATKIRSHISILCFIFRTSSGQT